jgi:carboxypeptidase C (cathepsin A)
VPYYGSEEWTRNLGYSQISPWRPWQSASLSGAVTKAGYVTEYDSQFTFVTVQGAGHMVPTFKPRVAFTLFS